MSNTQSALKQTSNQTPTQTFEEIVLAKLISIEEKLSDLNDSVEALEVRISDMDLDTGLGYEID